MEDREKITLKRRIKRCIKWFGRTWVVLNLIGLLVFVYTWLVGKTGKFQINQMKELIQSAEENHGAILVSWHGRALMLPFFWKSKIQVKALVSPHSDGRIIARVLKCYHVGSIDGSSDRRAAEAAVEIMKELKKGNVVTLISDGPRGPRMRLNKSVIYFAKKSGKPILGLTYSSENAGVLKKSWDAMLVPKLFQKGVLLTAQPFYVPKDATEEEMEELRQKFEDELNDLTFKADKMCGIKGILPGEKREKHG